MLSLNIIRSAGFAVTGLLLLHAPGFSQDTIEQAKPRMEGRFQIIEVRRESGSVSSTLFKIDTETGKTWVFQYAPTNFKEKAVPGLWTEIPNMSMDDDPRPANIEHPINAKEVKQVK